MKATLGRYARIPTINPTLIKRSGLESKKFHGRCILPLITASTLICGIYLPEEASAQTTAKDLLGTWTLVSITIDQEGKKIDFYGPNPQGQETYDSNGHVSVIITRSDLPKF